MTPAERFVRASRVYDVQRGECVNWDWAKQQPVSESQREVEQAVREVEAATDGGGSLMYNGHPVPSDSESNEYATPRWLIRGLARTLPDGFDLDAAAGAEDQPIASERYTKEDDGLVQPWNGYAWCNPPWSSSANDGRMKDAWLRKARQEVHKENVDAAFVLLPDDVSTEWFRTHGAWATTVTFLGRIKYEGGDRNPAFGSMLLTFGDVPGETIGVLENMGPTYQNRQRVDSAPQATIGGVVGDE